MDERMIKPYGACSHIGEKKDMKISPTTKVYGNTTKRGTIKKIQLSSAIR